MAAGELTTHGPAGHDEHEPEHGSSHAVHHELREGEVITASGQLSSARRETDAAPQHPFSAVQLARLDEALTLASRETGLDFSVYLGQLDTDGDGDTRAAAEKLHASIGARASHAVLIAASPGQRRLEIVSGHEAQLRVPDRSCKLAVMSMVASFKEGDLIGGLVSALRMLTDQAGSAHAPQR